MSVHVIRSTSAPSGAPSTTQLGNHWIKTSNPFGHWIAISTDPVTGWYDVSNLASMSGDMKKSVYDANGDGSVNLADESTVAVNLKNVSTAGNSKYYGTDATGASGFHALPSGVETNGSGTTGVDTTITGTSKYVFDKVNLTVSSPLAGSAKVDLNGKPGTLIGDLRDVLKLPAIGGPVAIVEDFEDATYNFTFTGSWGRVDNAVTAPQSGTHCFASNMITDSQSTEMSIENLVVTVDSTFVFWAKASSEYRSDILYFYINGVDQDLTDPNSGREFSGDTGWVKFEYPLVPGTYTFKWKYEKDSSSLEGDDRVYLDNISLTPGGVTIPEQVIINKNDIASIKTGSMFADDWAVYWKSSGGQRYVDRSKDVLWRSEHQSSGTKNSRNVMYGVQTDTDYAYVFVASTSPNFGNQIAFQRNDGETVKYYNSPQHGVSSLLSASNYSLSANKILVLPVYVSSACTIQSVKITLNTAISGKFECAIYNSVNSVSTTAGGSGNGIYTGRPSYFKNNGSYTASSQTDITIPFSASSVNFDQGIYWIMLSCDTAISIKSIDSWRAYTSGDASVFTFGTRTIGSSWVNNYISTSPTITFDNSSIVPLLTLNCTANRVG